MTAYDVQPGAPAAPKLLERPQPEHLEEPRPIEIPADMRAPTSTVPSTGPMPDVAPSASPATPETLPVVPSTSEPPHPSESSVAISIFKFRGLCHTLQTLTTSQSILTQHMIALRATRSILSPPKPSILPSLGRYNGIWVFYCLLSTPFLSH